MSEYSSYLTWLIVILAIALIVVSWRLYKRKKEEAGKNRFVADSLAEAQTQKAVFELKQLNQTQSAGIAATIQSIAKRKIQLLSKDKIPETWKGTDVEAYFKIQQPTGPVFFVFTSRILNIGEENGLVSLEITRPDHLRVEKKRHFIRVKPDSAEIALLSVWPIPPGTRLPGTSSEVPPPALTWKTGDSDNALTLDNISGAGIALTLRPKDGSLPFAATSGKHLLSLIVCRPDGASGPPLIFWSAGEIKNARQRGNEITLGIEFTNTAVQQKGNPELHWTHSSPWRGVKPIIQWVQRMDRSQN